MVPALSMVVNVPVPLNMLLNTLAIIYIGSFRSVEALEKKKKRELAIANGEEVGEEDGDEMQAMTQSDVMQVRPGRNPSRWCVAASMTRPPRNPHNRSLPSNPTVSPLRILRSPHAILRL